MVMKVFYKKQNPNIIKYRSYCNFDNEAFISNLRVVFSEICNENELLSFETFKNIVDYTPETHAPLIRRYVRAKQAPFMNRKINKEIMKSSRLRNKFLSNLKTKDVNDNKTFWKTVKPVFTDRESTN